MKNPDRKVFLKQLALINAIIDTLGNQIHLGNQYLHSDTFMIGEATGKLKVSRNMARFIFTISILFSCNLLLF